MARSRQTLTNTQLFAMDAGGVKVVTFDGSGVREATITVPLENVYEAILGEDGWVRRTDHTELSGHVETFPYERVTDAKQYAPGEWPLKDVPAGSVHGSQLEVVMSGGEDGAPGVATFRPKAAPAVATDLLTLVTANADGSFTTTGHPVADQELEQAAATIKRLSLKQAPATHAKAEPELPPVGWSSTRQSVADSFVGDPYRAREDVDIDSVRVEIRDNDGGGFEEQEARRILICGLDPLANPAPTNVHSTPAGFAAQVLATVRNRGGDYGAPADNHQLTADLMTSFFSRKFNTPVTFSAEDVCIVNMLQKMSRLAYTSKDDSYLDICGYAENVAMLRPDQRKR